MEAVRNEVNMLSSKLNLYKFPMKFEKNLRLCSLTLKCNFLPEDLIVKLWPSFFPPDTLPQSMTSIESDPKY